MTHSEIVRQFVKTHPDIDFYHDRAIQEEVESLLLYDEHQIEPYTVESPLLTDNGEKVTTAFQWMNSQRGKVVNLLKKEMYGEILPRPERMRVETFSVKDNALDGLAIRKEINLILQNRGKSHTIPILVYMPKDSVGPPPIFVNLNFKGNHTVTDETDVRMTGLLNEDKSFLCEEKRGCHAARNCFRKVVQRGYAAVTTCYHDIFPDRIDGWDESVYSLFMNCQGKIWNDEKYTSIGAWAWGLSRLMDYIETDSSLDSSRVALHGLSRLGKTALWAGALDERFKIVISNESGLGGAAMTKRCYGELYLYLLNAMPHWFVKRTERYIAHEELQNFDQHFLLSLIAPRPLAVASAADDQWSDPHGEYLGAYYAGEVYRLFGGNTLKSMELPPYGVNITSDISYHIRTGKHDQTEVDWMHYLEIADHFFKHTSE